MQFVFIAFQNRGLLNITKVLTTCFSSYNSFLSNQTRYRTSPSALFSLTQFLCLMNFEEKYFPLYILLTDQTSLNDCVYFLRYLSICFVVSVSISVCHVKNFEIYFFIFIKPFSCMTKKVRTKIKIS